MNDQQLRWAALLAVALGLGLFAAGITSFEYHSYTEIRESNLLPGALALWDRLARFQIGLGVALSTAGILALRELRRPPSIG